MSQGQEGGEAQDAPSIEPRPNGSFKVRNLKDFRNSRGEAIEVTPVTSLCRCGKSQNSPFCDGTHREIGFCGDKAADRVPDRVDTYVGSVLAIHDNQGVCAHVGYCVNDSPAVFEEDREPWVMPDADDPEATIKTIRRCPSGALSYTRDGILHRDLEREPAISIFKNGPLCVVGGIALNDPDGNTPESIEHYTLCRCGGSKNKPFCDGAHSKIDFQDDN